PRGVRRARRASRPASGGISLALRLPEVDGARPGRAVVLLHGADVDVLAGAQAGERAVEGDLDAPLRIDALDDDAAAHDVDARERAGADDLHEERLVERGARRERDAAAHAVATEG